MRQWGNHRQLLGVFVAILAAVASAETRQSGPLAVVSTGPTGEIQQLTDANEIRVIFSEPMVALGRVPDRPSPAWMHIEPAMAGAFRWSGTTILIFTPDPAAPLPYATRYRVTIDASAESAVGHRLGTPVTFEFTTPTVRLQSARWYRRSRRFDEPVVLALTFNQRVRPTDVAAHLAVHFAPHDWEAPVLSDGERARLSATEPAGLREFDAKVAAARRAAQRTDAVAARVATDWDKKTFPAADNLAVLETTIAPAPGTWLELTLDTGMPSPGGPARPPQPQSSTAELDPMFFAQSFECRSECDPSWWNPVRFSNDVAAAAFARALSIRDLASAPERPIAPTTAVRSTALDQSTAYGVEDAGFDRQPPISTWAYRLDPSLTAADGQTLGYPWLGIVANWHERAFVSFGDGHGVWETDGGPQLPFSARNYQNVTQWIAPVTLTDLPRIAALLGNDFKTPPPGNGTARRLTVTPDAIQAHGLNLASLLSPQGTGLFWAAVAPGQPIANAKEANTERRATLVQVTNLGITVKDSPQSTLVFVTRLDNGEPVADAKVSIVNLKSTQVWQGSTGRDGVVMAPALPLRDPEEWFKLSFLVTAEKNGDIGYVASDWNEGIEPWDFDLSYQLWEASDILRGSVFTDRGVYKPGEDVHVKAMIRADTPNGIRLLPAGSTLDVRVRDARNKIVDRRTVTVNKWSSAEWIWTVRAEASLGNYSIETMLPGTERPERNDASAPPVSTGDWLKKVHGSFLVAAYRRPDFRVDATLTADPAIAGGALHASLSARYLFGSAMARRPVKWTLTREPDLSIPSAIHEKYPEDKFAFGYYPEHEQRRPTARLAGETASLDADGRLNLNLPTKADADYAFRYTIEGDVEDVSRQHIANRASVTLHPAPWYIGIRRPDFFVDTAKGASVDVVAVDPAGAAVAGVTVALSLKRIQWNSVRRAEGGGFYTWETERIEVPAGDWTVVTGSMPVAQAIPAPEGGNYILRATAKDADGRSTRTELWFYALGPGYTAWERFDHNRIQLEPEHQTWKPGDRARVMIKSPWESATALLTVEREGVRRYERFALTSTQQTVEVPITEADIPNVFVSVLLIRGRTSKDPGSDGTDPGKPAFRLGYTELRVEDASKTLEVKVSADRAEYRPANTAKVSVTTLAPGGRGVAGEVTLWAVDYGILSLTDYRAPDVLHAVYQEKALQVMTEDSRQKIVSRRVMTPKGANEGGGGGAESGVSTMRRDFRPLAFWLGSVETDASGRATKDITLPESLTTYRIMAVAGDAASRFGSANAEIRVSKPVTLLAAFPRFMGLGDRASFGGVITNTLSRGGDAVVTIRSLDPAVLEFQGSARQTIHLDAGGTAPVRFDAAARATGNARVQMTVSLGSESDAFEMTLPVSAVTRLETQAAFGDTDSRTAERLMVPAGIVPGLGGLQVDMASTALVGLGEGARYLVDYPFGCAEQKASSALALMLAADLGSAFSMSRIAPADYRRRATDLLNELPRFQCADGGFEYWPGGCTTGQAYLTSYILHVMKTAAGLGIAPADDVVKRALDFLEQELKADPPPQVQWQPVWGATAAFATKVLAEYGRNQDANITRLQRMVDRLPIFALSYLADAMTAARAGAARLQDVERRLANALRVEGDQAHVEETDSDLLAWLWNSNVRASALVLDGLVRRNGDAQMVQRLVRWLLAARHDGRWRNTQENATALEALVSYYKKYEAEAPDMTASVTLGAATLGTATFRGRSSTAQSVRLAMPDLLRRTTAGVEQELAMSRAGTGRLFYSTRLQFAPLEPPPAADQGMRVERRYEKYVEGGGDGPAATSFGGGDLIRVTLTITLPKERRYVAVSDALPAGVEPVDGWFRTTAADLARDASSQPDDKSWMARWRRGGFDRIEKFDDRIALFATRLSEGRHVFSYLVRATTGGTFTVAGTWAEEMYAPEVNGRSAPATVVIK